MLTTNTQSRILTVLFEHPAIADCAVFGLPHKLWVEEVVAAVVFKQGNKVSSEELVSFCRKKLAGFKIAKRFFVVESIPKNPSGKTLKTVLREQYKTQAKL